MAITRQSDSIWVEAAMGYGHSNSPARDDDHYGLHGAAHAHGESMGRVHAGEAIDSYHRDAKGRFAPTGHHESEKGHAEGKLPREHRDSFKEGYHKGFEGKVREHEKAEKEKANKTSAFIHEAEMSVDPVSGRLRMDEPGLFHYRLGHGGSAEGYTPPSWLSTMGADVPLNEARNPTPKDPHRYDTDTLQNIANHPNFGLNIGLSNKAPFSPESVGLDAGDKRRNRKFATLRPGELASRPIQVADHEGNVHTFVHQITAPNLNPHDSDNPDGGGSWVVSLHHHISRPDGSAEWLPSEVTEHTDAAHSSRGKASDDLFKDIWGQLHANSDMVTMYGAGAQRTGDKNKSIQYEFRHPAGDVVYKSKLANGWNKHDGYYYDPLMPKKHPERIAEQPQWIVTGHALERQYPHDPKSPTHMALIEGSDRPNDQTIQFDKDDLPGVIQHIRSGLGVRPDSHSYRQFPQNAIPNTGGNPAGEMIKGHASVRPWVPENNIHRSAERLPIEF